MQHNFYIITFQDINATMQTSRTFSTIHAARKYAAWLASQNWASDVVIYKGGVGGQRVEASK